MPKGGYMVASCPECGLEVRVNLERRLAFHGCAGSKALIPEWEVRFVPYNRRKDDKEVQA